jgi:hypothetical protein
MIIVGNTSRSAPDYLHFLGKMIENYALQDYVRQIGVHFEKLLNLMSKSKIYLHPMIGEPFWNVCGRIYVGKPDSCGAGSWRKFRVCSEAISLQYFQTSCRSNKKSIKWD